MKDNSNGEKRITSIAEIKTDVFFFFFFYFVNERDDLNGSVTNVKKKIHTKFVDVREQVTGESRTNEVKEYATGRR